MKVRPIRKVVDEISEEERRQVIEDYEKYEKDGYIGDCVLRDVTSAVGEFTHDHPTIWMREVAFETYRYYADKYFEEND